MTTQLTPVLFLFFITTTTTNAASVSAHVPWFREKYLKQVYNDYYMYYRWKPNNNDRDKCPEIHKPAVYFAITGQQLWPKTPLTNRQQRELNKYRLERQQYGGDNRRRNRRRREYTPHYIHIINVTVAEVVYFMIEFIHYCCEILILLLSIIIATLTTLILYRLIVE
jgi:hypothetical protein